VARLTYAFRLCVARPPAAYEIQRLAELLKAERAAGGEDEESGHQAWVALARVLLNLDETITRE
jgi:hypothetical protein